MSLSEHLTRIYFAISLILVSLVLGLTFEMYSPAQVFIDVFCLALMVGIILDVKRQGGKRE